LAARRALLEEEKELTRRSDELRRHRQELPWVRIDKEYRFDTDEGSASLADLFRGRSQILVYHFMFGPDYTAGCPSCSAIADGFNGFVVHLANHDVMLWAVSRAPLAKLQAYKRRMGWNFPWASSLGSDFNFDFNVSVTEAQQREGTVQDTRCGPHRNVRRTARNRYSALARSALCAHLASADPGPPHPVATGCRRDIRRGVLRHLRYRRVSRQPGRGRLSRGPAAPVPVGQPRSARLSTAR